MLITVYKDGGMTDFEVTTADKEDIEYFESRDIRLSAENLGMGTAIYALFPNMDEEEEILVIDFNGNPEDAFKDLRNNCEKWENR